MDEIQWSDLLNDVVHLQGKTWLNFANVWKTQCVLVQISVLLSERNSSLYTVQCGSISCALTPKCVKQMH